MSLEFKMFNILEHCIHGYPLWFAGNVVECGCEKIWREEE